MYSFDLIKVHLAKEKVTGDIFAVEMFLTSKANSFGAIIYQWFDGLIQRIRLKKGYYYSIDITQAREYQYLQQTCATQSFFECVASDLISHETCFQNDSICSPFSLPGDIPICETDPSKTCWKEIKELIFPKCMTKKSCHVYEYDINRDYRIQELKGDERLYVEKTIRSLGGNNETISNILQDSEETILLDLEFDELDWSKGDRTKELQLDVYTEYYVWTEVALIGSVGGQLGLFIGFSFLGSWGWLMSKAQMFWKWVTMNDNPSK